MKTVLLLVILKSFHVIFGQSTGCEQLESNTCSSCLLLPNCAWCSDVNYTYIRCNTEKEHTKFQCNMTVTGNPDRTPKFDEPDLSDTVQLTPRKVQARVRVGEPIKFRVDVQPSKNYPVDFYILMDLSASMDDDLNNVKKLALNISAKLSELTSRHRLAFGSFVDKVVPPYVTLEKVGLPYADGKDIPYDFKHVLNFTKDANEFRDKIGGQVSSGNRDSPEGTLDALMQVAACEEELGWGSKNSTRRMVLIATDDTFHMAGEGRFGGAIYPNDAKCHLGGVTADDVRFYSESLRLDYPTLNQVLQRLSKSRIQPIFAIGGTSERVRETYRAIAKNWATRSATMGILDESSTNIIPLIEKSYNDITSRVSLDRVNLPDGVDVDIESNCGDEGSGLNECTKVTPGKNVSFEVSVTVTSCKFGNKSKFELSASSFGVVEFDLDIICSCDCEKYRVANSTRCNGTGTLECGSCQCNEGWAGEFCQCDIEESSGIGTDKCRQTNETLSPICSDNGVCECGLCQCNVVPGRTEKYYGRFCECSNFNCEQANNQPCGGDDQGRCECGKCICDKKYTGSNCGDDNCIYFADKCLNTLEDGTQVNCSNRGQCTCKGICRCDSFYEGKYCEFCPSCAGRCGDYKICVLCEVFGVKPDNVSLCDNCPTIKKYKSFAELKALNLPATCQETDDDGCTYFYSYDNRKNETVVHVVENKDCPEGPDVLLIVLAVIGGIVGIGIILLILWKLLTAMVDRREYQKFEKDRAKSKWHREKNPLYQPAVSTVQNPTFVGSKS